jgi:hypothetical protein
VARNGVSQPRAQHDEVMLAVAFRSAYRAADGVIKPAQLALGAAIHIAHTRHYGMGLVIEIQTVGHQLFEFDFAKAVKGPGTAGTATFAPFPGTASAMLPTMLATGGPTLRALASFPRWGARRRSRMSCATTFAARFSPASTATRTPGRTILAPSLPWSTWSTTLPALGAFDLDDFWCRNVDLDGFRLGDARRFLLRSRLLRSFQHLCHGLGRFGGRRYFLGTIFGGPTLIGQSL